MAKIVHEINGVLHSNLRHDLKTNIRDLRLPAAADSLKMHPQDSFRFKYAKNTSSFERQKIWAYNFFSWTSNLEYFLPVEF